MDTREDFRPGSGHFGDMVSPVADVRRVPEWQVKLIQRELAESDEIDRVLGPMILGLVAIALVGLSPVLVPLWCLGWCVRRVARCCGVDL